MSHPIEVSQQPANNFVSNSSRYLNSEVIYWSEKRILTFKTYKRKTFEPSSSDKFMVIKHGMEFRPDLIAKKAYGSQLIGYWWKIMEANNIRDVFDLKAGVTLRIPAIV